MKFRCIRKDLPVKWHDLIEADVDNDILVFEIDDRPFGVSAGLVVEVVRAVTPQTVPRLPDTIMGIINLRGSVVPVLDTRMLLHLPMMEVRHTDHLIIVRDEQLVYAIHADRAIDLVPLVREEESKVDDDTRPIGLIANTTVGFVQIIKPSELLSEQDRLAIAQITLPRSSEIPS